MFGWLKKRKATEPKNHITGPCKVVLPVVPPRGAQGGKGSIAYTTSAESLDAFVQEVVQRFAGKDTPESLIERAKQAWKHRVSVEVSK